MPVFEEEMGGDSACWAHLADELYAEREAEAAARDQRSGLSAPVDVASIAHDAAGRGPAWTVASDDLNVNLLVFGVDEGVAEHVNAEVDVLLIGISGEGIVTANGQPHSLRAGEAFLVAKGARRSTQAVSERFAYLTCHRRRAGLMPSIGTRPAPQPQ